MILSSIKLDKNECRKFTFSEKESLQVVPESDGDDWEVCRESEDRKKTEKVVHDGQVPGLALDGCEVEGVQVVQLGECEHSGESKLKKVLKNF